MILLADAPDTEAGSGSVEACLEILAGMHRQVCPRQVLGVRMGRLAADLLDLELPRVDKRLLAIVETDGCFADSVSVATGCWLGQRTLRLVDYGKVAVTLVDTLTDQAVRIWPHPLARTTAEHFAPDAASRWHAQLIGYQRMPTEQLLCAEPVELVDRLASLLGQPGRRDLCVECGEEVLNQRAIVTSRGRLCGGCARGRYFRQAPPQQRHFT